MSVKVCEVALVTDRFHELECQEVATKKALTEFKEEYQKERDDFAANYLKDKEHYKETRKLDNEILKTNFNNLANSCFQKEPIICSEIKSTICLGDITITSTKKFSRFSKWLWKKLFGWEIKDYYYGDEMYNTTWVTGVISHAEGPSTYVKNFKQEENLYEKC